MSEDRRWGEKVAVKVLDDDRVTYPKSASRFRRESRRMAANEQWQAGVSTPSG